MPQYQHYIPRAHLKLFLEDKSKERKLHVYSKKDGYLGRKPYKKIAGEDDSHPETVESKMSFIEGLAAEPLRKIAANPKTPLRQEDWFAVYLYMAFTAARHPERTRHLHHQLRERIIRHPLFLLRGKEILSQETFFQILFTAVVPDLAWPLHQLHWTALTLADDADEQFAISDRGVDIAWSGDYGPPNQDSLVLMPISRRVLLVGAVEPDSLKPILQSPRQVNARLLLRAYEYIFSTHELDYAELHRMAEAIDLRSRLMAHGQEPRTRIWTPHGWQ